MLTRNDHRWDSIFNGFDLSGVFGGRYDEENEIDVDIIQHDDKTEVFFDIFGYSKDDVNIACEDGYLIVTGERKLERPGEDSNYIRKEIVDIRRFSRKFKIVNFDGETIDATVEDGILKIILYPIVSKQLKQIEIK